MQTHGHTNIYTSFHPEKILSTLEQETFKGGVHEFCGFHAISERFAMDITGMEEYSCWSMLGSACASKCDVTMTTCDHRIEVSTSCNDHHITNEVRRSRMYFQQSILGYLCPKDHLSVSMPSSSIVTTKVKEVTCVFSPKVAVILHWFGLQFDLMPHVM